MRRRHFITFLGSAAATWPLLATAQQRMRRIGILEAVVEGDPEGEAWVRAFLQELEALGWQRDVNVQIDVRWGASNLDRIARNAKCLSGIILIPMNRL